MADGATIVEREEVRVLFRRTAGEQEAISRTWAEVEAAVGSLRGRKFYGTFDPESNEYRACVQWQDGDDADVPGLEDGTLAGGRYAGSDSRSGRISIPRGRRSSSTVATT